MKCSVIIPVYRYWDKLPLCLEALLQQTLQETFEIIVVNNEKEAVSPAYLADYPGVRLIHEPGTGSYAARNAGLAAAGGELIAFTDADCIPDKDWLKNAVAFFEEDRKGVRRIAGEVKIIPGKTRDTAYWHDCILAFKQEESVQKGVSVTANLIVRRELFGEVGYFDDRLVSGGDVEWNLRATKRGEPLAYVPACLVHHPARNTAEILRKGRRQYSKNMERIRKNRAVAFLQGVRNLRPPLRSIRKVLAFRQVSAPEKMKVIYLLLLKRVVVFGEHYRLLFGGERVRS